ncbi:hypothetical protein Ao3042_04679 [Aspergillus oryzae 3.042]|uniref:Altered inheritance of mitochondria protein 9, mitochondrial n=1 Tax=Aspergillus oryzae (strain 3.042) TaxID=1160506 RepID=I8IJ79_ASPO3|nr:hypothetical protein Ao3042_04679 [Aspergillus oryzae 3.042]|eukprot:EIT78866.1 hypothetical protein Ao3042_04679 [Aspergillus oryzae 3.042]
MLSLLRSSKRIQRTQQIAQISLLCRDTLCDVAASAGGDSSRIVTIEKLEGGFSKALLMKKGNGKEVIAKLPCRIAGPTSLTTACEVGVLEYVRKYTSIPAPRVFSWSSDNSNPVGAEYIIMEKVAGVPLFEQWGKMAEIEKLELIKNLTKLEAQLAAIRFPAYGGLYRQADVSSLQCQDLNGSICIGPSCGRSFSTDSAAVLSTQSEKLDYGPLTFIWAIFLLRLARTQKIVSLIDFQSLSVLPLFLQAQWPVFLKPPQNYTKGLVQPKLPGDFDELDEEGKAAALQEWSQSKLAKAYEVATVLENGVAHNAMNIPRVFRELFIRCGEVSEVGVVPLRECLIEIFRNWSSLGFTGQCPYSFSNEEITTHEHQFAEYQAWDEVQQLAQECLDTDAEGWIAPQLDIEEKRRQNRELLSLYIKRMAGEKSPDEARAMWPFPG